MSKSENFRISRVRSYLPVGTPAAGIDLNLLIPLLALSIFGILMVFSASYPTVLDNPQGDTYRFLKRQALFALIGFLAFFGFSRLRLSLLRKAAYPLLFASFGLLVYVLIFGREINGARSWIEIGPFSFQPSEMAKVALVLSLAKLLSDHPNSLSSYKGLIWPIVLTSLVCGLVLLGKDFGTTAVTFAVVVALLFLCGARVGDLFTVCVGAAGLATFFIMREPYRIERILSFIDPVKYADSGGYQILRGLIALGSGGTFGFGFAHSREKYFYLPAPHTDSIFAVIGEELGFVVCVALLAVFAWIGWYGFKVARSHQDSFAAFAAAGMTTVVLIQAAVNVLVILSWLPPTGLPLPFISYGGSSLLFSLIAMGIVANVARSAANQARRAAESLETSSGKSSRTTLPARQSSQPSSHKTRTTTRAR